MWKNIIDNRYKIFIILLSLLFTLIASNFLTDHVYSQKKLDINYIVVEVGYGEDLWTIAERYRGNESIYKTLSEIKSINNIDFIVVYPGDLLKVPVYY